MQAQLRMLIAVPTKADTMSQVIGLQEVTFQPKVGPVAQFGAEALDFGLRGTVDCGYIPQPGAAGFFDRRDS